jgi:tetratricopeptide (TPR) repeat protein
LPEGKWDGSVDQRASSLPHPMTSGQPGAFQQAILFHNRGRLREAAQLYEAVLKADDRHFGAVHRLGLLRLQQRKFGDAARLLRRAVKIDRNSADAHLHLAAALTGLGRFEDAIRHYQRALAIRPDLAEAHNNLGYALQSLGRHEQAAAHYEKALGIVPDYAEARNNFGNALQLLGRSEEAIAQFEKALVIRPNYAEAHKNFGNVLGALGRNEEAIAHYEKAIAITPTYAEAHESLGNALTALERPEEAIGQFERALALKPDHAEAYNGLGLALGAMERHEEAIAHYEQAIAIKPEYVDAHGNLGNALWAMGRNKEAIASHDRALAIKPGLAAARWNRSNVYLSMGDWVRGFRDYECRWEAQPKNSQKRSFTQPLWLGEKALAGHRILLHAEQGLGDTLMSVRYVPQVVEAGAAVTLEVQPALQSLLAQIDGVSQVLAKGEPLPGFDVHCPLMSLPLAFGTILETVPAEVPYLEAQQDRVLEWRHRVRDVGLPRIGIAWRGNWRADVSRSIPLPMFLEISSPQFQLISLQKEITDDDKTFLQQHGVQYFDEEIHKDFSDTAALIALTDLVVSIDTSVAHLAGAMGKPVWIPLKFSAEWRWLQNRDDSVWYPTARLFRQPASGDWKSVIARVRQELETYPWPCSVVS